MNPKWLAASMLGLFLCQDITAEDKKVPPDPRLAVERQDLQNVLVAARRSIGSLSAQEMVFVSMSIQRLEAIVDKIPAAEPPKPPEAKQRSE